MSDAVRRGKLMHSVIELREAGWGLVVAGHYEDGSVRTALIPPKDLRHEFGQAWHIGEEALEIPALDSFPLAELPCPVCEEPRYVTPSGEVCKNRHGG